MKEEKEFNNYIILDKKDNVCTALKDIPKGIYNIILSGNKITINIKEDIKAGFKICISNILKGEKVYKYGYIIGVAKSDIKIGEKVHIENMSSLI